MLHEEVADLLSAEVEFVVAELTNGVLVTDVVVLCRKELLECHEGRLSGEVNHLGGGAVRRVDEATHCHVRGFADVKKFLKSPKKFYKISKKTG